VNDVPEVEARELLALPRTCEDAPDWKFNKLKPGLATMECGLIEADGSSTGLQVHLAVARSTKTKLRTFKFSVFHAQLGGLRRVYQLHITATAHNPKNWHDLAHEHIGTARIPGQSDWLGWAFEDVLQYFCQQANITFIPPMDDPEAFKLKP
jgi:hypothetical protein